MQKQLFKFLLGFILACCFSNVSISQSPTIPIDSTFQLSPNAFGILPSGKECESILEFKNSIVNVGNSIRIDGNKVILEYHNTDKVKELFTSAKDGIAIDLLREDQFSCGVANGRNPSPIFDGVLLKPIYRNELLKSNSALNKNRFIAVVGIIPDELVGKGNYRAAMIIIKNGYTCHWSSPVEIPHKTFAPIPYALQTNSDPIVTLKESGIISSKVVYFQFKRNITSTTVYDPIPTSKTLIHSIEITSFSSIEGDSAKNHILHTERGEFMKKMLSKSGKANLITVNASENWEKCLFQLEMLGKESTTKLSHDSIRKVLYLDKANNWDSLFNTQRRSHATIYYQGNFDKKNMKTFLSMNLRTALLEKNIPLAKKALDSLYKTKLFCPLLVEESTLELLFNFPELVANTCAVLSLSPNFKSEELIRYVRYWLINYQELDSLARQNLLYLYSMTCKQLLDRWDVSATKLAKVLHPSRADKVMVTVEKTCPSIIMLDYNIGTIEYFSQVNEYKSIQKKFENIDAYFKTKKSSMNELEQLALFYNHWGCFDITVNLLYKEIGNPLFSKNNAFILAQTAAARSYSKSSGIDYMKIMKKAHEKDPILFCSWISQTFNLLVNPDLKNFYCEKCVKLDELEK